MLDCRNPEARIRKALYQAFDKSSLPGVLGSDNAQFNHCDLEIEFKSAGVLILRQSRCGGLTSFGDVIAPVKSSERTTTDFGTLDYKFASDVRTYVTFEFDDGIERIEFYLENRLEANDTEVPYEWLWDEAATGFFKLTVISYDVVGHSTTEEMRDIFIINLDIFG